METIVSAESSGEWAQQLAPSGGKGVVVVVRRPEGDVQLCFDSRGRPDLPRNRVGYQQLRRVYWELLMRGEADAVITETVEGRSQQRVVRCRFAFDSMNCLDSIRAC